MTRAAVSGVIASTALVLGALVGVRFKLPQRLLAMLLAFAVDDCRKTYVELSAKGVTFLQEPSDRPYGVEAVTRDNSGNWLVLVEPKDYRPEDFS